MSLARSAALSLGVALTAAVMLPAAAATAAAATTATAAAATTATAAPAAAGARAATAAAAAPSAQDRQWMVAAHQSNLTEIAAGKAAQQKATTAKVRNLGAMFVSDHTSLDAQLTAAAKSLGVSLPATPNAQQRATLAAVAAKSGSAFDAAWLAAQVAGHRQALAATDTEIANGSDATALKLARAARPIIAKHYAELTSGGTSSPTAVGAGTGGQAATDGTVPGLALTGAGTLLAVAAGGLLVARRRSA